MTAVLAIALALGTAPAGADGAAPADAPAVKARRAAEWLRDRARLAKELPAVPHKDAAEVWEDWAELRDAGDLDGDGKGDVVDLRSRLEYDDTLGFRETLKIEAYRGSDGKALWNHAAPTASFVYPIVTTVGIDGKPGVVVVAYHDADDGTDSAGGGGGAVTITSLDRSGKPLWVRALNGAWTYAPVTYASQVTDVVGVFDAVSGGGKDLLLRTTFMSESVAAQGPVAFQFAVMDGATGAVRPVGQPITTDYAGGDVLASGDLGGDNLDDVVAEVVTGSSVSLVALSTADGKELWKLPKLSTTDAENFLTPLPDVTGDGRADVGAETMDFGGGIIIIDGPARAAGSSSPMPGGMSISVIDGAKGKKLWTKSGSSLMVLGNADRRAGAEVAIGTPTYGRSKAGFTVTAFTGAGRKVWSVTRSLKGNDIDRNSFGAIGDVGGDGIADIGYAVVSGYGKKARRDEGVIDGRTGRVTRDPRPDMFATRAALDGRGTDAFEAVPGRGVFTLHTWRGDRPARLWSVTVRASGFPQRSLATSVDGDKCGDIAFTLSDGTGFRSVVFSGSTGKPLWQLDRAGVAAAKTGAASVVSHRTYNRGC